MHDHSTLFLAGLITGIATGVMLDAFVSAIVAKLRALVVTLQRTRMLAKASRITIKFTDLKPNQVFEFHGDTYRRDALWQFFARNSKWQLVAFNANSEVEVKP